MPPRSASPPGTERARPVTELARAAAGLGDDAAVSRDLDNALSRRQLSLAYQPQVSLVSGRVSGVEALLRWNHHRQGTVAPASFVPLAERSGSIVPIGNWVVAEACRQAVAWRALRGRETAVRVAVNVSARQFDPGLVDTVRAVLEAEGLQASHLCLELTETAVMDDLSSAADVFAALGELGVQLSIDDFGTGHSSLAYLKQLPFHELKIDKSFVDGLDAGPEGTAIVAAIVAMAQALGLAVVAEGVEHLSQLRVLRDLGCDEAQGFLLARPMPAADVDVLLKRDASAPWAQMEAASSTPGCAVGRSRSVLVVEDAEDVRKLAHVSLAAAGFVVHEAVDGEAALVEARRLRPACVLLDLALPRRDGLEVCDALRSDPATADGTIVVLSTSSDAMSKIAAFTRGADDYIMKPASPRELAARVRVAMDRRWEATR